MPSFHRKWDALKDLVGFCDQPAYLLTTREEVFLRLASLVGSSSKGP